MLGIYSNNASGSAVPSFYAAVMANLSAEGAAGAFVRTAEYSALSGYAIETAVQAQFSCSASTSPTASLTTGKGVLRSMCGTSKVRGYRPSLVPLNFVPRSFPKPRLACQRRCRAVPQPGAPLSHPPLVSGFRPLPNASMRRDTLVMDDPLVMILAFPRTAVLAAPTNMPTSGPTQGPSAGKQYLLGAFFIMMC